MWREQDDKRAAQPNWFILFPWLAEEDGELFCRVCSEVIGARQTLTAKKCSLERHEGPLHDKRVKDLAKLQANKELDAAKARAVAKNKSSFQDYVAKANDQFGTYADMCC